jgi:hypothetical protein
VKLSIIVFFITRLTAQIPGSVSLQQKVRETPDAAILVEAGEVVIDGTVILNGKNLTIHAETLVLHGTARITAFSDTDVPHPADRASMSGYPGGISSPGGMGELGKNGNNGNTGRKAGRIEIVSARIVGGGILIVRNDGEPGQAGQGGAAGGSGGQGGTGDHAGTYPCYRWLSIGGRGGNGGAGGRGGRGGDGGDGGEIWIGGSLSIPQISDRLILTSSAGNPGPGGLGGQGGRGGKGGNFGAPSLCGPIPPGPLQAESGSMGQDGYDGEPGHRGKNGLISPLGSR